MLRFKSESRLALEQNLTVYNQFYSSNKNSLISKKRKTIFTYLEKQVSILVAEFLTGWEWRPATIEMPCFK
jgi:hypothetical protein